MFGKKAVLVIAKQLLSSAGRESTKKETLQSTKQAGGGAETAKSAHFLIASPNPAVRGIFMNKKHYC